MALVSALFEILQKPTIWDVGMDLMLFVAPLWIAVLVGVLVGWAWKPSWATFRRDFSDLFLPKTLSAPHSPASPSASSSPSSVFASISGLGSLKSQFPSCFSWVGDDGVEEDIVFPASPAAALKATSSSSQLETGLSAQVNKEDLRYLSQLVESTDGGPAWIQMMDRSAPNMSYQAWRRDTPNGPTQYRTRSFFEDATPEMVRDFFWDDSFRPKWDTMLIHASTLEECPATGTMVVQWIRKFPFFCSDREYIIGRRIWDQDRAYYCVTKGVPSTSVPRRNRPRRVDLYYSSWCIRAVESQRGTGQFTACEVLLFHYEDMGIPWEIAKLGVKQGMWGAVKKIEPGLRVYQQQRASGVALSSSAVMAQINTKVGSDYLKTLESTGSDSLENDDTLDSSEKPGGRNIPKLLVIGGAVVLACSLDKGLVTKAVIFGIARKFARIGRRF